MTSNKIKENKIKDKVAVLSPDLKSTIYQLLMYIFDTGMYMRRWQGPGHKYPVKEYDTNKKIDPEKTVNPRLHDLNTKLDQLKKLEK